METRPSASLVRSFGPLVLYSATMLLSAFLLFWVQPLFARLLLPRFGGAPAVWNTCLLFYQGTLLLGYAYAHWLSSRQRAGTQTALHVLVLLVPLAFLPIGLAETRVTPDPTRPIGSVLSLLGVSLAVPFFVLSTSAPLLQRWYSRLGLPLSSDPYPLYAASNLGSMLALLAYPFVLEPAMTLSEQQRLWSVGYGVYGLAALLCAVALLGRLGARSAAATSAAPEPQARGAASSAPSGRTRLQWLCLSFVPSSLVYGVTTMLATDVAAVPLLWIVPLALYLLTFVVAFAARKPRRGVVLECVVPLLLAVMSLSFLLNRSKPAWLFLLLHLTGFVLAAYLLHRELADRRPAAEHLTGFFLWISLGGVLSGLFNAIAAPLLFDTVLEYPLALLLAGLLLHAIAPPPGAAGGRRLAAWLRLGSLALAAALVLGVLLLGVSARFWLQRLPADALALLLVGAVGAAFALSRRMVVAALASVLLLVHFAPEAGGLLHVERSFFAVHKVLRLPEGNLHMYQHGTTDHGRQSFDPAHRRQPQAYFHPTGPIGQAFAALGLSRSFDEVAVVGLGAGTLAAYSRPSQNWTFYEIDPVVEKIATDPRLFTYLEDSAAPVRVVIDDGRLALEKEPAGRFDLLILDAFSSDAIPVHLFTLEAFRLYLSRLAPHGIIALQITNRFLRLEPIVAAFARELGLVGLAQFEQQVSPQEARTGKSPSHWVLLAREPQDLGILMRNPRWRRLSAPESVRPWTDDYSDILGVLRLED